MAEVLFTVMFAIGIGVALLSPLWLPALLIYALFRAYMRFLRA